jgi:hypothetical protein
LLKSGTVPKVDQKYLEVFKYGNGEGWRRSFGPTLREIRKFYLGVEEERNILYTINKRKSDLIGHLLHRNCRQKAVIEGKIDRRIEMTGGRVKRRKNLMNDPEGKRGCWRLEAETLGRAVESSLWKRLKTCRKSNYRMNEGHKTCCYVVYIHYIHILVKH